VRQATLLAYFQPHLAPAKSVKMVGSSYEVTLAVRLYVFFISFKIVWLASPVNENFK